MTLYLKLSKVHAQDEKSDLHYTFAPGAKMQMRQRGECNTFAIVQIHVQMSQAMSAKRYLLTNLSMFHYNCCNYAFQSWHHKNGFQIESICVLSCRSHLHLNFHHSKCVAFTTFAFWHRVQMCVQI